jgi:hypothetical protein
MHYSRRWTEQEAGCCALCIQDGSLIKSDAGYFMVNLDRNTPRILRGWLPELVSAKEVCCDLIAYRAVFLSSCIATSLFQCKKKLAGVIYIGPLVDCAV